MNPKFLVLNLHEPKRRSVAIPISKFAFMMLSMRCILGCRLSQSQSQSGSANPWAAMDPVPPRADAEPSVRHWISVMVPRAVRINPEGSKLTLSSDGAVATNLSVGTNMATGLNCDPKVYCNGEMLQLGSWALQDGFPEGGYKQVYQREIDGIPKPGGYYVAEVTFTFFETDLPAQHFWQPQAGKFYRVLWSQSFRTPAGANRLSEAPIEPHRRLAPVVDSHIISNALGSQDRLSR